MPVAFSRLLPHFSHFCVLSFSDVYYRIFIVPSCFSLLAVPSVNPRWWHEIMIYIGLSVSISELFYIGPG